MKKLALTVGIILLVMVFFACGGSSASKEKEEAETEYITEETEEETEEIAEEETEEEPERDKEGYKQLAEGIKEKGGWFYITPGVYHFGDILENKEYYYFEVVEGEGWLWFDSWEEKEDEFDEFDDMLFLTKGQYITLSPEENDTLSLIAFDDKGFTVKCF